MNRRIGLLGGTFDPIHNGHVGLGLAAEEALSLTELVLIPARIPPHRRQPHASVFHRFAVIALTVAEHARWSASDVELSGEVPSYTATTLARFHAAGAAPAELYFVIGADAFADIEMWHNFPAILDQAHFAVVSRPGLPATSLPERLPALAPRMRRQPPSLTDTAISTHIILVDRETPDISSTTVRQRCAENGSIDDLVVPAVARYIERHGLYRAPGADRSTTPDHPSASRLHDIH